jgi:hypothetical protein
MRRLAVLLALAALLASPAAQAHGDLASEYLVRHEVFLPYDLKVPSGERRRIAELVDEANRAGYTIRVAMIWSSYDLGALTELWHRPQAYARFLAADMKDDYRDRLLVVMPNGFGFDRFGHPATKEHGTLSKIRIEPGLGGFAGATQMAVRHLAAASGVTLTGAVTAERSSETRDRLIIVLGAIAALLVAIALRLVLRRRG